MQSQNSPVQPHVLPENANPKSMRMIGGIASLIDTRAEMIPQGIINLKASRQVF